MDITILKEQIMKNELGNLYVFTGYEIEIQQIYLKQMSKVLDLQITRADSVLSIYNKCVSNSLFGSSRGFYVIRNDFDIQKQEKFYENLSNEIKDNVIVLLYDKLDSRTKFSKFFKDRTVAFEKLAENVLKSYIKKDLKLSDKNLKTFIQVCSGSYDLALLEIDKVKHYREVTKLDDDKCFEKLLSDGTIYQPEEYDVFKFIDAFCSCKFNEALGILEVLQNNNVQAINILGTLYGSLKSIMLISLCDGGNISEITGLDKGQIYYNRNYVKFWNINILVKFVKLIPDIVSGIKNGTIDDVYAVKYLLACM